MNAIVTGGSQGIGRAIVEKLVSRGDTVFIFDCTPPKENLGAIFISVDVSSVDSICAGFEKIDGPIDILVNNAVITRDMLAVRLRESEWDAVLDVNLKGAFFCAQQALKRRHSLASMMKQKKSYIVNISSVVGLVGNPGQINYAASKAGLLAVTKTLAKEYAARNVLVNAIAPGFIQTRMTEKLSDSVKQAALAHIPLKRFGTPQDVANIVSFLTSGDADYLTGQVIHVDGGMVV